MTETPQSQAERLCSLMDYLASEVSGVTGTAREIAAELDAQKDEALELRDARTEVAAGATLLARATDRINDLESALARVTAERDEALAELERVSASRRGWRARAHDYEGERNAARAEAGRLREALRLIMDAWPSPSATRAAIDAARAALAPAPAAAAERAGAAVTASFIDIVLDGPPSSHESGRFVEVEDQSGRSISVGEWIETPPYWRLRIPRAAAPAQGEINRGEFLRSILEQADPAAKIVAGEPHTDTFVLPERGKPTDGRCDSCGDACPGHPAFWPGKAGRGLMSWRWAGDHWQHRCAGLIPQAGHPGRANGFPPAYPDRGAEPAGRGEDEHACLTGDCDHMDKADCVRTLASERAEMEQETRWREERNERDAERLRKAESRATAAEARAKELEGQLDDIDSALPKLYEVVNGEPDEDLPASLYDRAEYATQRIAELERELRAQEERADSLADWANEARAAFGLDPDAPIVARDIDRLARAAEAEAQRRARERQDKEQGV